MFFSKKKKEEVHDTIALENRLFIDYEFLCNNVTVDFSCSLYVNLVSYRHISLNKHYHYNDWCRHSLRR